MLDVLQRTSDRKWPVLPRLVAGVPLAIAGLLHVVGAAPVEPLLAKAGFPAPGVLGIVAPLAQVVAGVLLCAGWMTRVGAGIGVAVMVGAIVVHFLIPNNQWPQPDSGLPGPEPVGGLVMAFLLVAVCGVAAWFGGGHWSADRRQVASRASARGGGLGVAPSPKVKKQKPVKAKKGAHVQPPADGESVW
ncbi:MAG: DoxX family protein [Phycisphaerales bacterium]